MRAWKLILIGFIGASVIAAGANLVAMSAGDPPAPERMDVGGSCDQVADRNDPTCPAPRVPEGAARAGPIQIEFGASDHSESPRSSRGAGQPVFGGSAGADADELGSDVGDEGSGEGHSGEDGSGEDHSGEEGSGEGHSGDEGSGEDDSSEDD